MNTGEALLAAVLMAAEASAGGVAIAQDAATYEPAQFAASRRLQPDTAWRR